MTLESERFDLARSAFRATLPTEEETRTVAQRLERRWRERTRRRRFAPILSLGFALAGALAYAAEAARSFDAAEPERAPLEAPATRTPRASGAPAERAPMHPVAPPPAATLASAPAPANATPALAPTVKLQRGGPSPRPAASWAAVARSLAQGDERAARLELERLSVNGNARDRANAAVELARLAAHGGECARAQKHLQNARAVLGSSPSLTRAEHAVKRCESSASPAQTPSTD
jgi:hypothetical protein